MRRALAMAALLLAACAAPQSGPEVLISTPAGQRDLEVLVSFFSGNWDSKPGQPPMRLRVAEFWKGSEVRWLYLEWRRPAEAKPQRQLVLRVGEADGGNMMAAAYRLPDPSRYAGEWARPQPFEGLRRESLRGIDDCRLRVTRMMAMQFALVTEGNRCPGDIPGAPYMRLEFLVTSSDLDLLEQPRDAAGNVPAGSRLEPLRFARQSRDPG
jgi:hypothetical protein